MPKRFEPVPFLLSLSVLAACGGANVDTRTAADADGDVVEMEELRITARRTDEGLEFDSYDAETLFFRATELLNSRRCPDAVTLYDRLADEFPGSRYRSPALYNAGLCLADTEDLAGAVSRFERLIEDEPESPDVKHATFNLAKLLIDLERYDRALEVADQLLRRTDLSSDERMEAMARRSQALLGRNDLDDAERQARMAVTYYRTRPEAELVRDPFFAAAANFVLAEAIREKAEAMAIPEAEVERQREVLERRAQYMLRAQREYFNTMSLTNAHWAAAAGYEIGAMYDGFWNAIMAAPTPPPRNPLPEGTYDAYADEYRHELARLVEPLIRHAIRYWELTLMMVERTQSQTPWAERIREDLERARQRLITEPGEPPMPDGQTAPDAEAPPEGDETGEALSEP
jgi:tetratricopeptide (TPR) repeat protein